MSHEKNDRLATVFQQEATVSQATRIANNVHEWNQGVLPGHLPSPSQQRVLNREETLPMDGMSRVQTVVRLRTILQTEGVSLKSTRAESKIIFPTQELAEEFSQLIFNLDTVRIGDGVVRRDTEGRSMTNWIPRAPKNENNQIYLSLFPANRNRNVGNENEIGILRMAGVSLAHLQPTSRVRFSLSPQKESTSSDGCPCILL